MALRGTVIWTTVYANSLTDMLGGKGISRIMGYGLLKLNKFSAGIIILAVV